MEDTATFCMGNNILNDEDSVTAVVVCTPTVATDLNDSVEKDSTETIATDDQAEGPLKKFKKRDEPCQLTTTQEVELVSWFQENRYFYDKSLREYRETGKNKKIYEDKAHELGLTDEQLKTWIESQRTRYGKLTSMKSGQGAIKLTERDEWITTAWQFLKDHIVRIPCRQSVTKFPKVEDVTRGPSTLSPASSDDLIENCKDVMCNTEVTTAKKGKTKEGIVQEDSNQNKLDEIMAQIERNRQERRNLESPKSPHEPAVKTYGSYFTIQCLQIRQDDWLQFTLDAIQHVNSYVAKARVPQYYGQQHQTSFQHHMTLQQQQQHQSSAMTYATMKTPVRPPAPASTYAISPVDVGYGMRPLAQQSIGVSPSDLRNGLEINDTNLSALDDMSFSNMLSM